MKVLVTGVNGQLGHDIVKECQSRDIEAIGVDVEEMDITDSNQVREIMSQLDIDAVIHCAAWTAVDKAEEEVEYAEKSIRMVQKIYLLCVRKWIFLSCIFLQIMYLMA